LHEHFFSWAGAPLNVAAGDKLYAWVYLDPANPPTEIMLSFSAENWEHRAYWGADQIGYGTAGTAGRKNLGALPAAGQWVRLEFPASAVDLEGKFVTGMSYSAFGGRVTWDAMGKAGTAPVATTPSTTTPSTPSTSTTTTPEVVWLDDAVPAGAQSGGSGGDSWNWVSSNPTPNSGATAHQSASVAGLHEHFFTWANTPLSVATGDTLFAWVYLDPSNAPSEIMLNFCADNWEHRAYWGANKITYGTDGTASRKSMGALPAVGQWVRLEIPASAVGLEGKDVTGMSFSAFDGRVTWDKFGKGGSGSSATAGAPASGSTSGTTTTATETVWFDDATPAGAGTGVGGNDAWNWITSGPAPFSGTKAHQSNLASGLHEHFFSWAGQTLSVATGEKLLAYVYIDPANPPATIMLSWLADNWEHRAYWGANNINYGTDGTNSRRSMGPIPIAGQWARLEVPASAVGLEGATVTGMSFSQFNGRATWDKVGKVSGGSAVADAGSSSGAGSTSGSSSSGSSSSDVTVTVPGITPPVDTSGVGSVIGNVIA
jgi:hypothetical protein